MLKVVAKCTLAPGIMEKAAPLYRELIEKTRRENGCIDYGFFIDPADETKGCFIETWESDEALGAHVKSEHFTRIFPQLRELGAAMGEISRLKALE